MSKTRLMFAAALSVSCVWLAGCGDGSGQKAGGDIKEAAGKLTGDDKLKHEGQKDQVVGGVKETVHDAKDAVKDATN